MKLDAPLKASIQLFVKNYSLFFFSLVTLLLPVYHVYFFQWEIVPVSKISTLMKEE